MPFVEDLTEFLQEDEFASAAELRLQAGTVRQVLGIFDEAFLDADLGEYRHETSAPRLAGRAADFAGAKRGDVLVIGGREFDVVSAPQIDGTGWATLRLAPRNGQGGR